MMNGAGRDCWRRMVKIATVARTSGPPEEGATPDQGHVTGKMKHSMRGHLEAITRFTYITATSACVQERVLRLCPVSFLQAPSQQKSGQEALPLTQP